MQKKGIYRPINMFLLKNLQFLLNHYETRGKYSTLGEIFEISFWTKIPKSKYENFDVIKRNLVYEKLS